MERSEEVLGAGGLRAAFFCAPDPWRTKKPARTLV
ncbi:hypothetical protein HPTD01_422 [Halomonas sp. TD01]|nr:hypothetical protein GME_04627 [Halomonas sp. TD01]CAH1041944.1 hypothetical protein HPTD01_422 [Halomonas sp. TD01]